MPLAVCFPAAVSVVLQNNNSMTVAAFLWRLSQNMGDDGMVPESGEVLMHHHHV